MKISKNINLCVLGTGNVGMSIVQAFAQKELNVTGIDTNEKNLEIGLEKVRKNIDSMIERGKMAAEQKDKILRRITLSTNFDDLAAADVVIESVFEDMDLKKQLFSRLDEKVRSREALLLTNTSTLSISEIASSTKRPEFIAGMHFFNPVPVMKLVEIVRGVESSDGTVGQIVELTKLLDKIPIISKDSPGFIVNRIFAAIYAEACRIVDEGVGSPKDVDTGVKYGLGHPMGPFELNDFLDSNALAVKASAYLAQELGDRYRLPSWIKNYVKAGRTGRSCGKGVHDYTKKSLKE